MDMKAKIDELVSKVKNDKDFAAKFSADPVKAVEGVIGIDLPDDQVRAVADGVKAQIAGGDLLGKVAGIFGKKD